MNRHIQNTFALENRGLSTKRTVFERDTCRADLEQAEQCRHDSYKLPQSLKYQGLLVTQNLGHGLNHEYLVLYFGKHIRKGTLVAVLSPHIIPSVLGMRHTSASTRLTSCKPVGESKFGVQRRGWVLGSCFLGRYLGSIICSIYELDQSQFVPLKNG